MQRSTAIQIVNHWSVPRVKELKPSDAHDLELCVDPSNLSFNGNIQQMCYAFPVYHMGNIVIISDSIYENSDLEKPLIQYRMKARDVREFACLKNFLHVHT